MTVQHGIKSLTFAALGLAFVNWAEFLMIMIIAGFCGTLIGKNLLNRMNDYNFRHALNAMLILLALRIIYTGVSQLTGPI